MKVKVRTEFKDKHTGKLHKAGDELEMNVDRINEVLKVGNFIELVADAAEPKKSKADEKGTGRRRRYRSRSEGCCRRCPENNGQEKKNK